MSGSREMSDIVKRLRGIRICENFALVEQAADEIERLRSRLASAQLELTHAANTCADQQCRAENAEAALVEAEKWVDALRAAAGKVTCKRCDDSGFEPWSDFGGAVIEPCSDCADLRKLLEGER